MVNSFTNALVSSGGAGTHFVNNTARTLFHPKGWKTHAKKNVKQPVPYRIVYLYSNPFDQIISFARRGFLNNHNHIRNMHGDVDNLSKEGPWILETYLEHGIDYFQIEDHFDTWMNMPAACDKVFVKYEYLLDVIDELEDVCQMPEWFSKDIKDNFIPRQSKWTEQDHEIRVMLNNMFGSFYERLKQYPPLMQC